MARTPGAINKNKRALLLALQARYPDYQPVVEMADAAFKLSDAARQADPDSAPGLWAQASQAHDRVAQYVTPKLKAIEVTGQDGGPVRFASMSDEELEAYARSLSEAVAD